VILKETTSGVMALATDLLAAQRVLFERQRELTLVALSSLVLEWLSICSLIYLAQWTSHAFLVLAAAVMVGMAARRADRYQDLATFPMQVCLPERHSTFGLCSHQLSAQLFYSVAAGLRVGSICTWLLMLLLGYGQPDASNICTVPYITFEDEDCAALPLWLHPGCGSSFSPARYQECVSQASWVQYGVCNLLVAQCRNLEMGVFPISAVFRSLLNIVSVSAPGLWLVVGAIRCVKWKENPWNVRASYELHSAIEDEENRLSLHLADNNRVVEASWESYLYIYLHVDLAAYGVDMSTDFICFVIFLSELNLSFAFLQLVIMALYVWKQLQRSKLQDLLQAVKNSRNQGFFTDEYLDIVQVQRTFGSPWSFLLQWYACAFVTLGWFPVFVFSLSLLSSLYGAVHASYLQMHLGYCALGTKPVSSLWALST